VWPSGLGHRLSVPIQVRGPGSIPVAGKLDFHPFGTGKWNSSYYVEGNCFMKTAELKRAAVRWPRVAYVAGGERMVSLRLTRATVAVVFMKVCHKMSLTATSQYNDYCTTAN
jgi:hypothetical protein